jgi:hypothetical protein
MHQSGFEAEIEMAEAARLVGNEGRARVCARRAAGRVARNYLETHGLVIRNRSAYDYLLKLSEMEGIEPDIQRVIRRFLLKVDEAYQLPAEIDLIADARFLADRLNNG